MPWGVAASVVGAGVSAALAPDPSSPQSLYVPTDLAGADKTWQGLNTSQQNLINAGNPYAASNQNAANMAGQQYAQLGQQAQQAGQQYNQQAQNAYGSQNYLQQAGQNLNNMATDPQNALYNRTQQHLGDQINVGQAQRGLGGSAVGGSEYNQGMSNFNIDWQNNQLARASTGLQGLNSAYNQAGQYGQLGNADMAASLGAGAQGAGYTQQSGAVPYNAAQGMTNDQLGQMSALQGQQIPYMNNGQGAQQSAYTNQSQAAGATGAMFSQGISALGKTGWGQGLFNPSGQSGSYGYNDTQAPAASMNLASGWGGTY